MRSDAAASSRVGRFRLPHVLRGGAGCRAFHRASHHASQRAFHRTSNGAPRHVPRGLTLVELLVAISVLAFVAVIGWRGLDVIVRARVSLNQDLEQTRGLQLALAQMQNDCAQIASPGFLQERAPLRLDEGRLSIVRTVKLEGQPVRVQVVSWSVRNGVLVRREAAPTRDLAELDLQIRNAAADAEWGTAVSLQNGVSGLAVRLWSEDGQGWRVAPPQDQAQAVAPASERGRVMAQGAGGPSAITRWSGLEMTLRMAGRDAPMQKIFLLGAT